jgi:hypothetical protein
MRPIFAILVLLAAFALFVVCTPCTAATVAKDTTAATQPSSRYQWHEGRWWYWLPENRWVYWENSRWNDYRPTVTFAAQTTQQAAPAAAAVAPVAVATQPCYPAGGGQTNTWASAAVGSWGGNYFGRPGF